MALILYRVGISIYSALISLLALFGHRKAKLLLKGRRSTWGKLEVWSADKSKPTAWFHCASLGEFEQGRPLIEGFKKEFPQYRILLTFFSPSGYEVRKNYEQADLVCYLPADTPKNAREFIELVKPQKVFFVKYEFWHFYLNALKSKGIPVLLFASIFRESQLFFKPWGGFYRKILDCFEHIFVQESTSLQLLSSINVGQVSVASDTRFDRVYQLCQSPKSIPEARDFSSQAPTIIVGSAWLADLEIIAPVIKSSAKGVRLIIAPHEIGEANLQAMEKLLSPLSTIRFSGLSKIYPTDVSAELDVQVLLIDNIGMLSSLYQYGAWAYIGGAFGKGLHNTLEAATFGLPIIFGEKYQKFHEAIGLIAAKAAISVKSSAEFEQAFQLLTENEASREEMGRNASNFVKENLGGTDAILNYIRKNSE